MLPRPSSPASPYAPILRILHSAFTLPNTHPYVAQFLFTPDPLPAKDIITPLQLASAPLVHTHFPHPAYAQRFALLPLFSNLNLTVGLRLRASATHPVQQPLVNSDKFVFDNIDLSLLAVSAPRSSDATHITYMSHSPASGRVIVSFHFCTSQFRSLLERGSIPAPLLLNALLSCHVYQQTDARCPMCVETEACNCAHSTTIPEHPMHFEALAPNFVLYAGRFSARRSQWQRSSNGILMQKETVDALCIIDVSVDEKQVSELCELESWEEEAAGQPSAGVESEMSGEPEGQMPPGESAESNWKEGVLILSRKNKDADTMLSQPVSVSSMRIEPVGHLRHSERVDVHIEDDDGIQLAMKEGSFSGAVEDEAMNEMSADLRQARRILQELRKREEELRKENNMLRAMLWSSEDIKSSHDEV